jgi:aminoglycoside phosphotransferase (APT) family kinase protein
MNTNKHHFDLTRLVPYLESQVTGFSGPVTVKKFADGQSNPTYLLTAASGDYVLRAKPPGQLLKSAHAVDREYQVQQALATTAVPVARVFHLCEDDTVIGSMFYIMDFVPGRIFWDAALPTLTAYERGSLFDELISVLAQMHNIIVDEVGLQDYGRPSGYFERQLALWIKQYRAAETQHIESMDTLINWLSNNFPADDGQVSLIHGDYRLDTVIFQPEGTKALAVLDWELSTLGHPLADLAYFCMCLRLPPDGLIKGLAGLDRAQLGIPSEADIVAHYCQLRHLQGIDHWHFYLAFSFFRLAAICQGVMKRALDGNASSGRAAEVGKLTAPLATMAVELIADATTIEPRNP